MTRKVIASLVVAGLTGTIAVSNLIAARKSDFVTPNRAVASQQNAASSQAKAALTLSVAAEGNEARYLVREQLAGFDLPNDAVGATRDIKGGISFDKSGKVIPGQSRITVGIASLKSDEERRDRFLQVRTLEAERFPTIDLVVTGIRGASLPLPKSGSRSFILDGNLTIRGVTKPTSWNVAAKFMGNRATGKAETKFAFADFGITQPRVRVVLSVADTIRLEYDFTLQRENVK